MSTQERIVSLAHESPWVIPASLPIPVTLADLDSAGIAPQASESASSTAAGSPGPLVHRSAGLSDAALVCGAQSGNRSAWNQLLDRYSTKIFRRIYRITRCRPDAEDALQDALLNAFTHLNRFEGRSSFASWLTRIAINSALMILRRRHRLILTIDDPHPEFAAGHPFEISDPGGDPESSYQQRERNAVLRSAVRRLPPKLRAVVELRYASDYSVDEVAALMGISISATKSRLSRARSFLRRSLAGMQ